MKAVSLAVLVAIVMTLGVAGVAAAQSPYFGYGYAPQTSWVGGYFTDNFCPGWCYAHESCTTGAYNRFGGGYFEPYRRFGGGYEYGPYLRFGGGYGVTPYSVGWSYAGY